MLYLIGIGLSDEQDLTLRAVTALHSCTTVYLDTYTCPYLGDLSKLETLIGKKVILADRTLVEQHIETILTDARTMNVAFLVVGDVFSATTHTDLFLRTRVQKIPYQIIHNTSILTAVGDSGLSLYKFGKITSIPFTQPDQNIDSPYDVLAKNKKIGLHTLFLLDLHPADKKFMTVQEALLFLLASEQRKQQGLITPETYIIGCSALGTDHAIIKYGTIQKFLTTSFPSYPHCLIIPGTLHFIEEDALAYYKL